MTDYEYFDVTFHGIRLIVLEKKLVIFIFELVLCFNSKNKFKKYIILIYFQTNFFKKTNTTTILNHIHPRTFFSTLKC